MNPLKFVIIGLGGYSLVHIRALEWLQNLGLAVLKGIISLKKEQQAKAQFVQDLRRNGVRIYDSIDHFFETGLNSADVLTVPIGIHQHVPVSIRAMQAGLDVYCEKPAAATLAEVDQLLAVRDVTNRKITIGFQHIYSHSIKTLKRRICEGKLGNLKSAALLCGWPRSIEYYRRNDWAGKMQLNDHLVLDTPANNAHAHYLLNMLYLTAPEPDCASTPLQVQAELYRANRIESADLVQMKFVTGTGTSGHLILAHCNRQELGPVMKLECENGIVTWQKDSGETTIVYHNGKIEKFSNETHPNWRFDGFKDLVEAIRQNREPLCPPELARAHTAAIAAMHKNCPNIVQIPDKFIIEREDFEMYPPDTKGQFRTVARLDDLMKEAFDNNLFFSEMGVEWAKEDEHIIPGD